jgi:hypothetical protein
MVPLPRLPINTGEMKKRGGDGFERRKDGEHLKTEKRETEQRRGEEEPPAVVRIAASTGPPSRPAATPP